MPMETEQLMVAGPAKRGLGRKTGELGAGHVKNWVDADISDDEDYEDGQNEEDVKSEEDVYKIEVNVQDLECALKNVEAGHVIKGQAYDPEL
ncbi:hypothetical protein FQN50_006994 [Emmonsiellopsis sp. PD_5]|nr:hypothetical protein FQN50_006994 [Emmonsiellopsis sp. PD_5]